MRRFGDPEPLADDHSVEGVDCGVASLNRWLAAHARQAAGAGSARTYVVTDAEQARVVGFHALTAASIERELAISRAVRGMPRHPIPAVLLARLAVDVTVAGRGVGSWLLRDAMQRVVGASYDLGIRIMLVHAISDEARGFYERFGFQRSPTDDLNLQMLVKDIAASLRAGSPGPRS